MGGNSPPLKRLRGDHDKGLTLDAGTTQETWDLLDRGGDVQITQEKGDLIQMKPLLEHQVVDETSMQLIEVSIQSVDNKMP